MNRPIARVACLIWAQYPVRSLALLSIMALLLVGCSTSDENVPTSSSPSPGSSPSSGSGPSTISGPSISSNPQGSNSPVKKTGNHITASPNPVPAGPEPQGKTTVAWTTQGLPAQDVHVYVVEEGRPETLFATAPEGSQEAPWIPSDRAIEFRLYSGVGAQRKLLDKVVVTRNH
jgi:hypothetical protein